MELSKSIKNYILEDEFKMTIVKNRVNIVNYSKIGHFDDNKILIWKDGKNVVIKGKNLSITRLLHDEILITGILKNVECNL